MSPPRADVTIPPGSSIDPRAGVDIATFFEQYAAWGLALDRYVEFSVDSPRARRLGLGGGLSLPLAPFSKDDMANLLDLGARATNQQRGSPYVASRGAFAGRNKNRKGSTDSCNDAQRNVERRTR